MSADTTEGLPSGPDTGDEVSAASPENVSAVGPSSTSTASSNEAGGGSLAKVAAGNTPRADLTKSLEEKQATASGASASQLPDGPRVDVSAATVARMMGIASTSDLRVLEGRIDLLTSKVGVILTKVDRTLSMFGSVPTASDIGRLEVQVAAIKGMLRELLDAAGASMDPMKDQLEREQAKEQSRQLRQGIKSNSE